MSESFYGNADGGGSASLAPVSDNSAAGFTPGAAKLTEAINSTGTGLSDPFARSETRTEYVIPRPEIPKKMEDITLPQAAGISGTSGKNLLEQKKPKSPKTAFERVGERNEAAAANLESRGMLTRGIAKSQVKLANAIDLGVSAVTHHSVAGPLGAAIGTIRGTAFGVIALGIAALATGGAALAFAPLIVGGFALGFTAYEGVKCYNDALVKNQKGKDIADMIYAKAVPTGRPVKNLPTIADVALPHADPNITTWRDRAMASKRTSPLHIGGR